jgi:sulfonate transport system substrate-binding protein
MFSRIRHRLAAALAALSLFSGAAAAATAPVTIRIASPDLSAGAKHAGGGVVDVLNLTRALEKEFERDGIKVEWNFFKGAGPAINEAFASRQLDFAFIGDLPVIIGRASGLDTRLLLAAGRGSNSYLAVVPGSGIRTLADLKGKRVGLLRGTADELSFAAALASQGLSEKDIQIINLDFNAVNAAIAARRIDATWATARVFALRDRGLVTLPVDSRQLQGAGAVAGGLVADQAFLDAHPAIAQRVVTTVVRALHWASLEQNRAELAGLQAEQSGYPRSIFEEVLAGADLGFVTSPLLDTYFLDNLKQKIALAREHNLIRKSFEIGPFLAPQFLEAALRELKLESHWKPTDRYVWNR